MLKKASDLAGKVILTCSLPMNANDTDLVIAHKSSGAEELAKKIPKGRVVSAFSTVPSEVLFSVFERAGRGKREGGSGRTERPSVVYCGEDAGAKKVAAQLISDAGFEPVDAGPLRVARYIEPFTLLVGQLAYEGSRGPALAYRFEWFEEREA